MAETPAQHATCIETTRAIDLPNRTYVCGPECPRPAGPDPARDARIDVYRDRERRRAARALDRYIEVTFDPGTSWRPQAEAGERFVEEVGDYVLSRLQQKSHYGIPPQPCYGGEHGNDDESVSGVHGG